METARLCECDGSRPCTQPTAGSSTYASSNASTKTTSAALAANAIPTTGANSAIVVRVFPVRSARLSTWPVLQRRNPSVAFFGGTYGVALLESDENDANTAGFSRK